jgi:hypothetical protein
MWKIGPELHPQIIQVGHEMSYHW